MKKPSTRTRPQATDEENNGHETSSNSSDGINVGAGNQAKELIIHYFQKWLGVPNKKDTSRVPSFRHSLISFTQATLSITALAFLDFFMQASREDFMFLVGSFGATAVLLYSAHGSPLAQPRAVLMGHFVSSLAGVTVYKIMGNIHYVSAGVAVGLAIFCMERTNSVHPPGGATALVAIVGGDVVTRAGYWYVLFPCLSGAMLMLLVALFCNNLDPERQYPQYWSNYFPLIEKGKSLAAGCFGGATAAGGAGTSAVSVNPLDRSNSSFPSYPDVASIELVDDADVQRFTPPRSQTPRAGWAADAAAAAAAGRAGGGRGHVVNSQVVEDEETASPVALKFTNQAMEKTKEVLHAAKEKASDILAPNVTETEHYVQDKVAQTTKEESQERAEILKRAEAAQQQLKQAPGGGSVGGHVGRRQQQHQQQQQH